MMRVVTLTFLLLGFGLANAFWNYQPGQVCSDVCGACGGLGELALDVCVCEIETNDDNTECLDTAKTRVQDIDLGWRIKSTTRQRRYANFQLSREDIQKPLIRKHRSPQNDFGLYGQPMFGQNPGMRPMQPQAKNSMYEILIGDENQDTVQMVFPQSDNIEVQHQYLFQDNRGMNHPCSRVISDIDLDFGSTGADDLWDANPTGFERPLHDQFYDYSDDASNPLYFGKSQDNLPRNNVNVNNGWLQSAAHSTTYANHRDPTSFRPNIEEDFTYDEREVDYGINEDDAFYNQY